MTTTIFNGFTPDFHHMRRTFPNGSYAMATATDGGGEFDADDWAVGLYIGECAEPVHFWSSDEEGRTVDEVNRLLDEWEATRLPAGLFKPVTDRASAEAWIEALFAAGMGFHFDDDPATILWHVGPSGLNEPWSPSAAEVDLLRYQRNSLYAEVEDWGPFECPIGYLLAVEACAETDADPETMGGAISDMIKRGEIKGYERLLPENRVVDPRKEG